MKLKNWGLITMVIIFIGCSSVNEFPNTSTSENSNIVTTSSSKVTRNHINMTARPHFDSFDALIADLKNYYSLLDLSQKQYDMINEYLAHAQLPDSLERGAFIYNQEDLIRNIKLALDDFVNIKDSMLSESVTEAERDIIINMVKNLVKSNIVHGFNNPIQINYYHLINYCANKKDALLISSQEIADILMQDFGSAFLVYPLPEFFGSSATSADWEIAAPPVIIKRQQQYQAATSIFKQTDDSSFEVHIVYVFEKQDESYRIVSSHLKQC